MAGQDVARNFRSRGEFHPFGESAQQYSLFCMYGGEWDWLAISCDLLSRPSAPQYERRHEKMCCNLYDLNPKSSCAGALQAGVGRLHPVLFVLSNSSASSCAVVDLGIWFCYSRCVGMNPRKQTQVSIHQRKTSRTADWVEHQRPNSKGFSTFSSTATFPNSSSMIKALFLRYDCHLTGLDAIFIICPCPIPTFHLSFSSTSIPPPAQTITYKTPCRGRLGWLCSSAALVGSLERR